MDNNGRDHVVYSLVQGDGELRHMSHEKRGLVGDGFLTEKEQQQLLLDEKALRETLEEEARDEKELEERIKHVQAHDELFRTSRKDVAHEETSTTIKPKGTRHISSLKQTSDIDSILESERHNLQANHNHNNVPYLFH
ncbi:hypothetical protein Tco_0862929 [Tanacetum coccineum]